MNLPSLSLRPTPRFGSAPKANDSAELNQLLLARISQADPKLAGIFYASEFVNPVFVGTFEKQAHLVSLEKLPGVDRYAYQGIIRINGNTFRVSRQKEGFLLESTAPDSNERVTCGSIAGSSYGYSYRKGALKVQLERGLDFPGEPDNERLASELKFKLTSIAREIDSLVQAQYPELKPTRW